MVKYCAMFLMLIYLRSHRFQYKGRFIKRKPPILYTDAFNTQTRAAYVHNQTSEQPPGYGCVTEGTKDT
jgi:hypothetical protein